MAFSNILVNVRFLTIMKKYSGEGQILLEVPRDPRHALNIIIDQFQIPWKGQLENIVRVFINGKSESSFIEEGKLLNNGDVIVFIPISSGG